MISTSKLFILFLFVSVFGGKPFVKHPLHVSTTEVDYNTSAKTVEITCKLFTDDFEDALSKTTKDKIDLSMPSMHANMDKLVSIYLSKNLKIKIDGNPRVINYLGFEIDREATNVYLEIENVQELKTADVYNTLLYNLFTDQMSIVHIVKNKNRISNKLLYPNKTVLVKF